MNKTGSRIPLLLLLAALIAIAAAAFFVLRGDPTRLSRTEIGSGDFGPASFEFRMASYSDLDGWREDDHYAAIVTFVASCDVLESRADVLSANSREALGSRAGDVSLAGLVGDWRPACKQARVLAAREDNQVDAAQGARLFFEANFQPVQILEWREPKPDGPARRSPPMVNETGLFTGYFEPIYEASLTPSERLNAAVLSRPSDLIEVDLGRFRDDLKGRRIAGRADGGVLVPYADHKAINDGALEGNGEPLAYMAPNDLFFLQIQGSGRLKIGDETLRVGYAGQNGRPYTAVGKVMLDRGIMPLSEISMQTIRAWLDDATPAAAKEMREENASYVFFTELSLEGDGTEGPLGAQGISLTAERSLAVDRRYHAMSAPIWVDLDPVAGGDNGARYRRLMIAQDTGGAIRGPIRGDVFWGSGDAAGEIAGKMRAQGRMYVLIPRAVARRLPDRKTP